MSSYSNDAETLFKRLDIQLLETLEEQYFLQPRYVFIYRDFDIGYSSSGLYLLFQQ